MPFGVSSLPSRPVSGYASVVYAKCFCFLSHLKSAVTTDQSYNEGMMS